MLYNKEYIQGTTGSMIGRWRYYKFGWDWYYGAFQKHQYKYGWIPTEGVQYVRNEVHNLLSVHFV